MLSGVLSEFCNVLPRMKLQYTRLPPSAPAVETPTSPGDTERWRLSPWSPSKWVRLAHIWRIFYWRKSNNDSKEMEAAAMESTQRGKTWAFLADFFTGENRQMTEQRDGGCRQESFQLGKTWAILVDFFTGENRPMTEQRHWGCLHGVNPNG